jgi:hypothetical protein
MATPEILVAGATDPTVSGRLVAWHVPAAAGTLMRSGSHEELSGSHPALGDSRLAVLRDGGIHVRTTAGERIGNGIPAAGADALAVSAGWVAWRIGEGVFAAPLPDGPVRQLMASPDIGRPALDGSVVAFHAAGRIVMGDLALGTLSTVRRERRAQLRNPSLLGGRLVYVRARYDRQELRLGPALPGSPVRDRRLWSTVPTGRRDNGYERGRRHHRHGWPRKLWPRPPRGVSPTVWTTALADDAVYVTLLRQAIGQPLQTEILRIPL